MQSLTVAHSRGYRTFSKWMASDDDFFVVRKFGSVSARCALLMQDRIQNLSRELEKQDNLCESYGQHSGEFRGPDGRNDFTDRRHQLLDEITWRLDQYSKAYPRDDSNQS